MSDLEEFVGPITGGGPSFCRTFDKTAAGRDRRDAGAHGECRGGLSIAGDGVSEAIAEHATQNAGCCLGHDVESPAGTAVPEFGLGNQRSTIAALLEVRIEDRLADRARKPLVPWRVRILHKFAR